MERTQGPQESFFESNSLAVSLSLLEQETKLHLKLESSLILSYLSSWQALKRCMRITFKVLVEFLNVHHHWEGAHSDGFGTKFESNIKRVV